jgi:hypothetical protein
MVSARFSIAAVLVSAAFGCDVPPDAVPADGDDVTAQVETQTQGLAIGPNDVGVLAPAGMNCPNEHVTLELENEREGNWNQHEGWMGATTQDQSFTIFHFCRADGRSFRPAYGTNTALNYAVLKLGATCPAGSVELERYFDNEDRPRSCPSWPWACAGGDTVTIGDITPNSYSGNNLHMKLCMFRSSTAGSSSPLPPLGIPYGVFAAPTFPGALDSGRIFTDDEDDDNANRLTGDFLGSEPFLTPGGNTVVRLVQVNPIRIIRWPVYPIGGVLSP